MVHAGCTLSSATHAGWARAHAWVSWLNKRHTMQRCARHVDAARSSRGMNLSCYMPLENQYKLHRLLNRLEVEQMDTIDEFLVIHAG